MADKNSKTILHQFPLSHFCEKVRLGLCLKGLEFEVRNHLPMLHVLTVRKISGQQMVPVLEDGRKIVSDSNAILKYLDQRVSEPQFFPEASRELHAMNAFIQKVDVGVGVHLRRFFYFHILKDKELACGLLANPVDYSRLERAAFRAMSPLVFFLMKKGMRITKASAERSRETLLRTLDYLDKKLGRKKYFFGNSLSAADITVAALLAPLVQPAEHPMDWPKQIPDALIAFRREAEDRLVYKWVKKFYSEICQ
jgi:glutathione S-transferase